MNDGGPAFPRLTKLITPASASTPDFTAESTSGMSLRDWFAGQALMGVITHYPAIQLGQLLEEIAATSYKAADAMLTQRTKEK